jgi:hypothetical protein
MEMQARAAAASTAVDEAAAFELERQHLLSEIAQVRPYCPLSQDCCLSVQTD